jgi:hypothetical protein
MRLAKRRVFNGFRVRTAQLAKMAGRRGNALRRIRAKLDFHKRLSFSASVDSHGFVVLHSSFCV